MMKRNLTRILTCALLLFVFCFVYACNSTGNGSERQPESVYEPDSGTNTGKESGDESSSPGITETETVAGDMTDSGSCGDSLEWVWYADTGILLISGAGRMHDYSQDSPAPWYPYRESIQTVILEKGVTSVGHYALRDCTGCSDIRIPDSVTGIGSSAFFGCTALKGISIPDGITSIGNSTFAGCTFLTDIVLPDSIVEIGDWAFYNTGYYNDPANWENGVLYIGNHLIRAVDTLSGSYAIKPGTKCLADFAFRHCTELTSITIPDGVTRIGYAVFDICTGLSDITIPDSVTVIGYSAFHECISLKNVIIPDSVTEICGYAFVDCPGLTDIVIPDSVTCIGEKAFDICTGLTRIIIPDSVQTIREGAFSGCTDLVDIYCEASVQPSGWSSEWVNNCNATVHWGYTVE